MELFPGFTIDKDIGDVHSDPWLCHRKRGEVLFYFSNPLFCFDAFALPFHISSDENMFKESHACSSG